MNRTLPRFLAVPLVFSLIFSSFFCCCLTRSVHAAANDQLSFVFAEEDHSRGNHCDSHDPAEHSPASRHECECPKLQGTLAKISDVVQTADTAVYFLNHPIGFGPIFSAFVPDNHKLLTAHSPPWVSSSTTPLYIKNSVLRI